MWGYKASTQAQKDRIKEAFDEAQKITWDVYKMFFPTSVTYGGHPAPVSWRRGGPCTVPKSCIC